MKNKVGLIVEHYSFRSDIRDLIDILSEKVDLILYINKCDEIDIKTKLVQLEKAEKEHLDRVKSLAKQYAPKCE